MVRSLGIVFALLAVPETAVAQAFEDKLELCMSCHGEKGVSSVQGVPSIAGRTPSEIVHQLRLFRSGQREHQQMVMAKRLTDQEIEQLAAYFSAKSLPR